MSWEAVAAISQIVGTIGVIITLGFLAIQIRGTTKVANAQARHSTPNSFFALPLFGRSMQIALPSSRAEQN